MKRTLIGFGLLLVTAFAHADAKPLIQIGVEVVEVNEQKTRKLGIDWMETLGLHEMNVPAVFKVGSITRDALNATVNAMLQHETADLLANPKLVTRDGSTANFHAGGELPYATSGSLGTVQVEFKPYGVTLKISPHLESGGEITLNLDAEVSGPDDQHTVTLSGNVVQGISTRQVSSQLTLTPGSTLTLAGLLQTNKRTIRKGIPGLMDIPVLGHLFAMTTHASERTSIIVFVTPIVLDNAASTPPSSAPEDMDHAG